MRNREVAGLLENIADLLEIKGESLFRIGAYREAARRIESLTQDIAQMAEAGTLRQIPGVGEAIATKIQEYLATGHLRYYDDLQHEVDPALIDLLRVPGMGPKKVQLLHKSLSIRTMDELYQAAREHRLAPLPGMGVKTEQNILKELERLQQRTQRHLLGKVLPASEEVVALLRELPIVQRADPAGSIRRMKDTIGDIDILVASDSSEKVMKAFAQLPMVKEVIAMGATKSSILTYDNLQMDLRVVEPNCYGAALQYFTGSKSHNIQLRELAQKRGLKISEYGIFEETTGKRLGSKEEEEIYHILDLAFIPPELRENQGEIEAAQEGKLPKLIEIGDIQGDLHVHTKASDGSEPLMAMASAARAKGYQYLAICDHSKSLGIARGLSVEKLQSQWEEIRELNAQLVPFRILAGTEVDIRNDGTLDYDDDTLRGFDIVTASIHSGFNQPQERIMERLAAAMHHPTVDVINHPQGRIIGARDPYAVDLEMAFQLAAVTGTALEINAMPDRLDLDDHAARRAKELGIKLTISTDAHDSSHLNFMRYGVATARRGWVEKKDVLNALPLSELLNWLSQRRRKR
ncbi:MAG: DNA polymerase/3'-5' exonuclease PolX [Chloroflexi bacterium]|nr:DNA polymerase/3'-5' exonuclease PolX [Chloroflexota bacterium]